MSNEIKAYFLQGIFCFSFLFILIGSNFGQAFERVSFGEIDSNNLYVGDSGRRELYYLKLVPKTKIIGCIVILPSGAETTENLLKQIELPELAFQEGILSIIPSINWGTKNKLAEIEFLDKIFREVVLKYNVSKENFVLGGLSNGGIVSLIYAQHASKNNGNTYLIPKGVFGLDVPLDDARFYGYCQREIERNFNEAAANEARWMIDHFYRQKYGGSPQEYPIKYIEYSIYSNGAKNGGNAKYLKDIPIRMYTDLDVNWLLNERRRDLYDWNGIDIISMINDLKLMGNQDANVVVTMGKGVRLDGTKHPHSWSIMDNNDCINWVNNLFSNK